VNILFLFMQGCEVTSPVRSSPEQATARTVPDFSYTEAFDSPDAELSLNFGLAIEGGDVNGDGYADGIVGGLIYPNVADRVLVNQLIRPHAASRNALM
jgi:hypothetical protein